MADFVKSLLKVNYTRVLAVGQTSNNTPSTLTFCPDPPKQIVAHGLLYYIFTRMAKTEKSTIKRW